MSSHAYESAARLRKAIALRDEILSLHRQLGHTFSAADAAEAMPEAQRRLWARFAKVNPPSDETWTEVVRMLKEHEARERRVAETLS